MVEEGSDMNTFVLITAVSSLVLMGFGWFLSGKTIRENGKRHPVYFLYLSVTVLMAVAVRYHQYMQPEDPLGIAVLKCCASLPSVLLGLRGFLMEKNRFDLILLIAIVFGMFADIAINLNMTLGGILFLIGHLLYDVAFVRERRPSGRQYLVWLILYLAAFMILFSVRNRVATFLFLFALVYFLILTSTIAFSYPLSRIIFVSAVVFAISDCFLVYNMIADSNMILKTIALVIYYFSVLLYGVAIWEISYPHDRM